MMSYSLRKGSDALCLQNSDSVTASLKKSAATVLPLHSAGLQCVTC